MNTGIEAGMDEGTAEAAELPGAVPDLLGFPELERASIDEREVRERHPQEREQVGPRWVDTPSSRRVLAALAYAREWADIAVIHGGAGVGKTMTARRYANECKNVWIAVMSPPANRLRPCLQEVAGALALPYLRGGSHRLHLEIVYEMRRTGGLLIVDEAQLLGHRQLEALRGLYDASGCGLALLGNDRFGHRIEHTPRFAALASRVGRRVHLPKAKAADVQAILDAWGVEGEEARKRGRLLAAPPGGLRRLVGILERRARAGGKRETAGRPRERRSQPGGAA